MNPWKEPRPNFSPSPALLPPLFSSLEQPQQRISYAPVPSSFCEILGGSMQCYSRPQAIPSSNILPPKVSVVVVDDSCPLDQQCSSALQYDADSTSECISALLENWPQSNDLQSILCNPMIFHTPSELACPSSTPSHFSSQSLPDCPLNSSTKYTPECAASICNAVQKPSRLPDLHAYDHSSTHHYIETLCSASNPPLPGVGLETMLSAPLNLGARAGQQPSLHLKARVSPRKKRTRAKAIKSSREFHGPRETILVEMISTEACEDGYVWHKYGRKSIKNRLHPRSYFKCAQPNCPVKKQKELFSDMQGFMLITYLGEHNHPQAQRKSLIQGNMPFYQSPKSHAE